MDATRNEIFVLGQVALRKKFWERISTTRSGGVEFTPALDWLARGGGWGCWLLVKATASATAKANTGVLRFALG